MPSAVSQLSRPKMLMITESTTSTATLVARKRNMRFISLFSVVFYFISALTVGADSTASRSPRALLGDDISWCIGVARSDAREDRGIDHPQALHAVHAQLVVHYRHGVFAHLAGTHGMEDGGAEFSRGLGQFLIRLKTGTRPVLLRLIFRQRLGSHDATREPHSIHCNLAVGLVT